MNLKSKAGRRPAPALLAPLLALLGLATALFGAPPSSAHRSARHRRATHRSASLRYLCAHHRAPASRCGSLFDMPLPADPRVDPNSSGIIYRMFHMGRGDVSPVQLNPVPGNDWGDAVFYSSPSDPVYTVRCDKPAPTRCPIEGWRIRIPAKARPASGGDAGMSVIEPSRGREYDLWRVQTTPLAAGGGTIVVGWGGYGQLDGWGAGTSRSCGGGSCTLMSKGIITYHDLSTAHINHAVYIVANCSNGRSVYPAYSGNAGAGECSDPTNAPAFGQWLQLNMSSRQINHLRAPKWMKAVYLAMARYGAMVYDAGSNGAFDIQIESPESFTALDRGNPFVGWAAQQRRHTRSSHVGAYVSAGGMHFWLDFSRGGIDWFSKLRVIAPCAIAGSC